MTTEYHVNGISMPGLSHMQNETVWAIFKMNDNVTARQVGQFLIKAKGTALVHLYRLEKKGLAVRKGSIRRGYRFSLKPWVKGEIRKGINRAWGKKTG